MNRIQKIEQLIAPAMKVASQHGLVPGGNVDEETYTRHWSAMEAVVDSVRAPLEEELTALRSQLAEAQEGWALSRAAVGDAYTARLAMERKIGLLREWIREEGERTNVCTFDILGGEICTTCRCERGKV